MKNTFTSIAMVLALSASNGVHAETTNETNANTAKSQFSRGDRQGSPIRNVVQNYMLEQGDITQGEIDLKKIERDQNREAIRALKIAGDKDGLKAKKEELKAKRKEKRTAMKAYIEANPELQTRIEEKKAEFKARRAEKRGNRKEGKRNRMRSFFGS